MKKYSYNADFFGQWFEKSGIKLTQLMKDLGVNNVSLKRWMKDKSNPIPVEKMILLCNIYDIDISMFFLEGEKTAVITPKAPSQESMEAESKNAASVKDEMKSGEAVPRTEVLQMRIDHMMEIQRIKDRQKESEDQIRKEYSEREDSLRKQYDERIAQYEARIDEYKDMVRDGMQTTRLALTQGRSKSSYGGYSPEGVADYGDAPRPHVNPNKR